MRMKDNESRIWRPMPAKYKTHIIIIAALICNVTAAGCVAAYLISADTALNSFGTGYAETEIIENFDPPPVLVPGVSFEKNVKVKNTGKCPVYVRVQAVFTDGDMEKLCEVDWNTADYEYKDGYYFYKKPLDVDDMTEPLFTSVTLSEHATAEQIKNFEILIYTEAYQSAGSDSYAEAWNNFDENCIKSLGKGNTA